MEHVAHDARVAREPRTLSPTRTRGVCRTLDESSPRGTILISEIRFIRQQGSENEGCDGTRLSPPNWPHPLDTLIQRGSPGMGQSE